MSDVDIQMKILDELRAIRDALARAPANVGQFPPLADPVYVRSTIVGHIMQAKGAGFDDRADLPRCERIAAFILDGNVNGPVLKTVRAEPGSAS